MKKLFTGVALVAILILPSAAHAAWWNPLDWFKRSPDATSTYEIEIPAGETSGEDVMKPVDNFTSKSIDLSARVIALMKENADLRAENATLSSRIASLSGSNETLATSLGQCQAVTGLAPAPKATSKVEAIPQTTDTATQCSVAKRGYEQAIDGKLAIDSWYQSVLDGLKTSCGFLCTPDASVKADYQSKLSAQQINIDKAKSNIEIYCQ